MNRLQGKWPILAVLLICGITVCHNILLSQEASSLNGHLQALDDQMDAPTIIHNNDNNNNHNSNHESSSITTKFSNFDKPPPPPPPRRQQQQQQQQQQEAAEQQQQPPPPPKQPETATTPSDPKKMLAMALKEKLLPAKTPPKAPPKAPPTITKEPKSSVAAAAAAIVKKDPKQQQQQQQALDETVLEYKQKISTTKENQSPKKKTRVADEDHYFNKTEAESVLRDIAKKQKEQQQQQQKATTTKTTTTTIAANVTDGILDPKDWPNRYVNGVLVPPFRVVQVGSPRSGTTFQYNLLDAIVSLKTPPHLKTLEAQRGFLSGWTEEAYRRKISHNQRTFIIKYHKELPFLKQLQDEGGIGVFASSDKASSYALYTQQKVDLYNCSLCEVDKYRPFFNLTDDDVTILKNYMSLYSIIRQCCGYQASKYEVARLNGCDTSPYKSKATYPNCENSNLTQVEEQFDAMPIDYHPDSPNKNWRRPGDCAYYRGKIADYKKGFNDKPFEGCDAFAESLQKKKTTTTTTTNNVTKDGRTGTTTRVSPSMTTTMTTNTPQNLTDQVVVDALGNSTEEDWPNRYVNGVLVPPFRIVQVGSPRSGTTFQYNLLDAIVSLKTPPHLKELEAQRGFVSGWTEEAYRRKIAHNQRTFILKYHKNLPFFRKLQDEGGIGVFASGHIASHYALYTQNKQDLYNCSLCEVDKYRKFFNLTDDDVALLKHYMSLYSIIRQCCGYQASKYEIARLNGCDVTAYKNKSSYPNCESHNLTDIELQFDAMPIDYHPDAPKLNWRFPGDCAYYQDKIATYKKGFMDKPFQGCDSVV